MIHMEHGILPVSVIFILTGCGSGYGSSSPSSSGSSGSSGYGSESASGSSGHTSGTARVGKARIAAVEVSGQYAFRPATITVKVGTAVTWANNTDAPHTVTSDHRSLFDKNLPTGKTVTITSTHPGTYAYHCTYHPYMHGKIVVTR